MEYLPLYSELQKKRHSVRPGITGWAQVNGRNAISWEEKFKLDVEYATKVNFWLDLKIVLLTVKKVLRSADIQSDKNLTMPKFTGNDTIRS
jgi:undecaprenyl phosphate N,N'-diacetylbacillosamine 1-phosphate transferase